MTSDATKKLLEILSGLTGEVAPLESKVPDLAVKLLADAGIGYSQFNELLLSLGYDRVAKGFFQYLCDGSPLYEAGATLQSLKQLEDASDQFRKICLLFYGNIKFGFKKLSSNDLLLRQHLDYLTPVSVEEFGKRHNPIHPIEEIRGEDTYYLGYLIQDQIRSKLKANPNDPEALEQKTQMDRVIRIGKRNHEAYLASDHLDVYVATSMRARHEYMAVHRIAKEIFSDLTLADLKLRWFDPTQAYCQDRIDKGLAEGLMLRRARCTVYLAQETDTFGKDSELASTLAQGKPVIAYVPTTDESDIGLLVDELRSSEGCSEIEAVLRHLRVFAPAAAWDDPEVRAWLNRRSSKDLKAARSRLNEAVNKHYDKRARTLQENHPLGIQVNLETGVANGVLVVRTIKDCAELVKRIVTKTWRFKLSVEGGYIFMRETISGSIFRVMTGDLLLSNSFWNFYLRQPAEFSLELDHSTTMEADP